METLSTFFRQLADSKSCEGFLETLKCLVAVRKHAQKIRDIGMLVVGAHGKK